MAEQQSLDTIVADLTPEQWQLPTPSPGWTVADQGASIADGDHRRPANCHDFLLACLHQFREDVFPVRAEFYPAGARRVNLQPHRSRRRQRIVYCRNGRLGR